MGDTEAEQVIRRPVTITFSPRQGTGEPMGIKGF